MIDRATELLQRGGEVLPESAGDYLVESGSLASVLEACGARVLASVFGCGMHLLMAGELASIQRVQSTVLHRSLNTHHRYTQSSCLNLRQRPELGL